jgi:hypothetical protein
MAAMGICGMGEGRWVLDGEKEEQCHTTGEKGEQLYGAVGWRLWPWGGARFAGG